MSKALVKRPYDPAAGGVQPTSLDAPVTGALAALNRAVDLWTRFEPVAAKYLEELEHIGELGEKETEAGRASAVLSCLEKLSRISVNMVKVIDEATRLRQMLTGGADIRPDIAGLGDQELQDILVETILARGLWRIVRAKAKERGIVIEGEVVE